MKKICFNCKNFIPKIMLNGYHGMCNAKPLNENSFVHFQDTCDDNFKPKGELTHDNINSLQ